MEVKIVSKDYQSCLRKLEESGFARYVCSDEKGLNGNVFTAVFTKENLVITIIHIVKQHITYIVTEPDAKLSECLLYKEGNAEKYITDKNTTLHMLELYHPGSCFVLQLKNGHFIVCDGGYGGELPYILDYLEKLVPNGEKPIVEAWLITHPHPDHMEVFVAFVENPEYVQRLYVEGIYMDAYDAELAETLGAKKMIDAVKHAATMLRTTKGNPTEIYRPHAGQRYYFGDITVDVMQTMVQVPREKWHRWKKNLNEHSTWYMFTIEGQKFLNSGDADLGAMQGVMSIYDREFLDMEIMAVQHHGINVYQEFTDFIKVKTLLYPYYGIHGVFKEGGTWPGSWQASVDRNAYLHKTVKETLSYGDGTKVLTFPYRTGTVESLPLRGERAEFTGIAKEIRIQY